MAWHTQLDDPIEEAVAEAMAVDVGNDTVADVGNVFRQGDRDAGPNGDIRAAQTVLSRLGTSVGEVDGVYGKNTMNAVQEGQEILGLPRTGVLDQATQDALNNLTDSQIDFYSSESEAIVENAERRASITQIQNDNQDQYQDAAYEQNGVVNWSSLPSNRLGDKLEDLEFTDTNDLLTKVFGPDRASAIQATIQAESGGELINEGMAYSKARALEVFPASKYKQGINRVFGNPDNVTNGFLNAAGQVAFADVVYGGRMGNDEAGDGFRYRGRGYVQITGKGRYERIGNIIGEDLVNNPDLMLDPDIAQRALVAYFYDKADTDGQKRNIFGKLDARRLSDIIGHATTTAQGRWNATGLPSSVPSLYASESSSRPQERPEATTE